MTVYVFNFLFQKGREILYSNFCSRWGSSLPLCARLMGSFTPPSTQVEFHLRKCLQCHLKAAPQPLDSGGYWKLPQPNQQNRTKQLGWCGIINGNPTRRNMEDDLNIFENERRPRFFLKENDLNLFENGRRRQTNDATKNNNIFENGRRPQFFENGK